jgi:hypothetical protein
MCIHDATATIQTSRIAVSHKGWHVNNAWWADRYGQQRTSDLRQEVRGAQLFRWSQAEQASSERITGPTGSEHDHELNRGSWFATLLIVIVMKARHGVEGGQLRPVEDS